MNTKSIPYKCLECNEDNRDNFYGSRKSQCKSCFNKSMWKRRKANKIKAVELLGGKCEICGYNKSISALEFHHNDPTEKDFVVGGMKYGWTRIEKELKKCRLVCANCHREIHDSMREI